MILDGGNSTTSRIPEDIIFQILKELPVKTLLKFRVVSKLWCSIIDNPIFVDSHRTCSYTGTDGIHILCQYEGKLRLEIYSTDPEGGYHVPFLTLLSGILYYHKYGWHDRDSNATGLQYVNGLVCKNFCIWNPSTRESIDLPPIRVNISTQFNLSKSTTERCNVFLRNLLGFDSTTRQYKRNLDSVSEKLRFRTALGVCCIEDVIFCLGWIDSTDMIVAFEVVPEKFRIIPIPAGALINSMRRHIIIQVGGRLGYVSDDYVSTGKVDVGELTTTKVVESLDYVEARDVDKVTNIGATTSVDCVEEGYVNYEVDVMTIWILEDYHKQQWKEEIITFPSSWSNGLYGVDKHIVTEAVGSIHISEILFYHYQIRNHGHVEICSYYDLESKNLRMVPKVTTFPKENWQPEDYMMDKILHTGFIDFTKHVECLFRLK
ncbi:hypothetical protein LguiB_012533 [Lonicera macranthoides]